MVLIEKIKGEMVDGKFKGREFSNILERQMARKASANLTYNWLIENDDTIIGRIPEHSRTRTLPGLGSWFCSAGRADEWEIFVNSKADKIPGYERELAGATESIRLCAALREAQGAGLVAALEGYR